MGYRESVGLVQVRSVLEMESHEEKIQEIIARNKEAEAKEELKRRAKQLEMQRREQQRRAASGLGPSSSSGQGGTSYGGGSSGYAPISQRFDAPERTTASSSPAPSALRQATFKSGGGMKLGSKKTKQAELLDALGGELASEPLLAGHGEEMSAPPTPAIQASHSTASVKGASANVRGSIPEVEAESINIIIRETLSLSLLRDGGVQSMELKGDMNLNITDPSLGRIRLFLSPPSPNALGNGVQYKQHPNVAKFSGAANEKKVIALKDSSKSFPIGQSLAVLKWRYVGTDESNVPLSINCWPTPGNDGTCEVSIEYELEHESLTLYDVVISIPLPAGSYPTVSSHSGSWSLNPTEHALDWTIPQICSDEDEDTKSGSMMFTVGGDDAEVFFPVNVAFVAEGSMAGVDVAQVVNLAEEEREEEVSVDRIVSVEEFVVV